MRVPVALLVAGAAATFAVAPTRATQGVPTAGVTQPVVQEIDATTFALAFRENRASAYVGSRVKGRGLDFKGVTVENAGAGATFSLVLTVGAIGADLAPAPVRTWEEWTAADRVGTSLDVLVRSSGLLRADARRYPPNGYEFDALFTGLAETTPRAAGSMAPSKPCPDQLTHGPHSSGPILPKAAPMFAPRFYCVPVLLNATVR